MSAISSLSILPAFLLGALFALAAAALWSRYRASRARPPNSADAPAESVGAYYRAMADNAVDIMAIVNGDTTIQLITRAAETHLGHAPVDLIGHSAGDLVHPDDLVEVAVDFQRALEESHSTHTAELRLRHKDGRWLPFEVVAKNLMHDGDIAGIVVSARSLADRSQEEAERKMVLGVAAAMRPAQDRRGIVAILLAQLESLLDADAVALASLDTATGGTVVELARGVWADWTERHLPAGEGVAAHVIARGEPFTTADAASADSLAPEERAGGVRCLTALPLIAQGEPVGALLVGRAAPFDERTLRVLQRVGDMGANALRRSLLHEETQRRAEQLAIINQLGRVFAENPDLPQIHNATAQAVCNLLPDVNRVFLTLVDHAAQAIKIVYGLCDGRSLNPEMMAPLSLGATGPLVQGVATGQPTIVPNLGSRARAWPGLLGAEEGERRLESAMVAPMRINNEVIGSLHVQSYRRNCFTQTDLDLLSLIAQTAAIAVHNAELLTNLQASNADLRQVASDLRHLIDDANAPIFGVDADGCINEWNIAAERITGYQRDELLGQALTAGLLVDSQHRDAVRDVLQNALDGRPTANYELPLRTRAGQDVLILLNATLRRDAAGNLLGVVAVGQDITERKRAEAKVQENARRAEVMAELSHALAEVSLRYQDVIDTVARRLSEIIGDACSLRLVSEDGHYLDMIAYHHPDPDTRALATRLFRTVPHQVNEGWASDVYAMGRPVFLPVVPEDELLRRTNPAYHRYVREVGISSLIIVPLRSRDTIIGVMSLIRDQPGRPYTIDDQHFVQEVANRAAMAITNARLHEDSRRELAERRRAEAAWRHSEATNRALLDAIPDLLYRIGRDGRVLDVRVGGDDFKIDRATLLGQPIERALSVVDDASVTLAGAFSQALAQVRETGETRVLQHQRRRGQQVDYFEARLIASGQDEVLAIIRDITGQQLAEEALRQTQKLESIGLLAGGIAHDFNNLLTGMLGQTSLALAKLGDDARARPHLEKAVTSAERAADLTRQLLAYAGKGQFQIDIIDLNQLIRQNMGLLETILPKHVTLLAELSGDAAWLEADKGQIQQVVMNLVMNAAEASHDESGVVRVATQCEGIARDDGRLYVGEDRLAPGNYISLIVEDDGAGMDAVTLDRMFDPFFTTKDTGRGLGLSATLGIIRAHGGGLQVESEPGQGSRFIVLFPLAEGTSEPEPPRSNGAQAPVTGTVLVIDDEDPVREAVSDILGAANIDVITAANGREGVELYRANRARIGVVLLDMQMPVMAGDETFRILRTINPDVRVILSSGYSETEATRELVGQSLGGFLQKPYASDELVDHIQAALR